MRLTREWINPFSFFKSIYINPDLHTPKEINTILAYGKIHIKGIHSLVILISEINLIFYWFNPGAWLMKTAMHKNLEFITDHKLVTTEINIRAYQYNLLKTASKRLGSGSEEAGLRLVKEMPDWEPAKRKNGQLIRTGYMLPVRFQL